MMAHGYGPFDHWIAPFLRRLWDRWIMPFSRCVFLGSFVALAHDKGPHDDSDLAEGDLARCRDHSARSRPRQRVVRRHGRRTVADLSLGQGEELSYDSRVIDSRVIHSMYWSIGSMQDV